jgi:hypothetical protein
MTYVRWRAILDREAADHREVPARGHMAYDMMERSSIRGAYWSLSMRVDVARRAVERLAARARTSILRTNPWSTATRQQRARHSPPGLVRDRLRSGRGAAVLGVGSAPRRRTPWQSLAVRSAVECIALFGSWWER